MYFKQINAIIATVVCLALVSCHSDVDLGNIDTRAEVELGVALPVGSVHATIGNFFGGRVGKFYVDTVDNKGVITWKDTFKIARNFHQVDLAKYISEKQLSLNVYEKIPAAILIGTNKRITGTGMPITLDFDMPLKLKGINDPDSLDKERLDSALIETASFSSIIKASNLPLEWEWIDEVTLDLGEQLQRPAGNTMVVYDKNRDHYGYDQKIPTEVDNFTINLMKKNSAGQYTPGQVIDSCNFVVHFKFTVPLGVTVDIPENAAFNYKLGVQFIDYKAIWGRFSPSKDMYDESTFDIGSSWGSLDFISKSKMPFADPKIDMHIVTRVAGALKVDGDYLYAEDAKHNKHYASFRYGGSDHQDFHRVFQKWEYLDPTTSAIGDSTTNMTILFDKDPERGRIDGLFDNMPQLLGYKFRLDFDYSQTPQIRITPNTSIRIDAICTLPMIFKQGVHIDYKDTIKDINISKYSIDSLIASVKVVDTLKATDISLMLRAANEIPLDIKAYMRCLDAAGNIVMDPADPSKPLLLFKSDTINFVAPKYGKEGGTWRVEQPGETTIIANLNEKELRMFPQIKHIAYFAFIDDETLAEAYSKGLENIRLAEDQGLNIKIGLTAHVDAILQLTEEKKNK